MRLILAAAIFSITVLLLACTVRNIPAEKTPAPEFSSLETTASVQAPWEVKWKETLAQAKKEGLVNISAASFGTNVAREIFRKGFTEKYGIELQWTVGPSAYISQKVATERRNGLYTQDISIAGGNTTVARYKPMGFLQALPPNFILPEINVPSAWLGGKLPFIDSEGLYIFAATLYPQSPLIINTKLIRKEEFASYKNLLNPKWKGKFAANDFTLTGGGLKWFSVMVEEDHGPILGLDFMRALANQDPVIVKDNRLAAEWLIKEKYPFGLNLSINTALAEYMREGIPISHLDEFTPKEGGYITTGGQVITLFDKAPHPYASRVFLNWLLSREGMIAITRASIKHSTRIDIPEPGNIDPYIIAREPGVRYVNSDEEKYLLKTDEYAKMAKEIFGHLLR